MTDLDVRPALRRPRTWRSGVGALVIGTVLALVAGVGPATTAVADDGGGGVDHSATSGPESPQSVQGPEPAVMVDPVQNATSSEWIVLCTSFSPCKAAGYGNDGYDGVYQSSFWSQYSGHNCTNYVAYRMIRNGMSSTRPSAISGNALNWGVALASQTNDSPAVGSVAWWDSSFSASGHVAYVERVVSSSEIYVSEDNWGGDFRWRKITRTGGRWPKGFIHLKDVATSPASPATYRPTATTRILDTRFGAGAPTGPVVAGREVSVAVNGQAGLPSTGVGAVVVNVSVLSSSSSGYTTMYPSGVTRPVARNTTFVGGVWTSSMYVSRVGSDGRIRIYTSATAQLTVDVLGWYPSGSALTSITPRRVLDTRSGLGIRKATLSAGTRVDMRVAGNGFVPSSGVATVVLGISTESPTSSGWVTAWPTGAARPVTTHAYVDPGRGSTAVVTSRIGSGGQVSINSTGTTELMVDVLGWFPTGSDYTSLTPSRLLDTRYGSGGFTGRVSAGGTVKVPVRGRGGVPSTGVKAVLVTLTSLAPSSTGSLRAYPTGWSRPGVGHTLYGAGRTAVNAVLLPVGSDGTVSVYSTSSSYIVVDVQGWVRT